MDDFVSLPNKWQEWEIIELIGSGSYGNVYKACFKNAGENGETRYSAVKVINIPSDENELETMTREYPKRQDLTNYYLSLIDDLQTEIKAMQALSDNPNIVDMQDYCVEHEEGSLEWRIFIRMELLTSFQDYRSEHEFGQEDVIRLGTDICSALEACRANNIIHRDIKPENIMVNEAGVFKLGDFGIAKQLEQTTGSMSLKGTFTYMAPEVYHGEKYDASVDQYSLGIVLYRLLNNNREPFLDPDAPMVYYNDRREALRKRMDGEVIKPPKNASESLARVVRKACSYRPENRYETPEKFKEDLLKCLSDESVSVTGLVDISEDEQKKKQRVKARKRRTAVLVCAVAAAVCITAAALSQKTENERVLEKSNQTEEFIRTSGVQEDENVSAFAGYGNAAEYQNDINDVEAHPEGEEALSLVNEYTAYLKDQGNYDLDSLYGNSKEIISYLDEQYCAVQIVYYDVVIDDVSKRERVDHDTAAFYLKKNVIGKWQICLEEDVDDISNIESRMNEIYLPQGFSEADAADRNSYIDRMRAAYWVGDGSVFSDDDASANAELAAAWQNADGSVDVYFICRNAADYVTHFSSYWLCLEDSRLGDVLLAYGYMDISADAGTSDGFILHFDAESIPTGTEKWTDLSNYFSGMNTNENL